MKPRVFPITGRRQVDALRSAVRQEIIDTVQALGPCSIAMIAGTLGRSVHSLYYHVRHLVRVGLLRVVGYQPSARRAGALYGTPADKERMLLRYDATDATNRQAVNGVVVSMLRVAARDFRKGFLPHVAICQGDTRNLWAGRHKGWLNPAELKEVNALLKRLTELLNQPRSHERKALHTLTFVLAPVKSGKTHAKRPKPRSKPG